MALFVGERIGEARPLNVNAAIDLGSELASEFFLLSVAIGLLLMENYRSSQKDAAKAADLSRKFENLQAQLDSQKVELKKCREALGIVVPDPSEDSPSSSHPSSTSSPLRSTILSAVPKEFASLIAAAAKAFSFSSSSSSSPSSSSSLSSLSSPSSSNSPSSPSSSTKL